jgi:hypothetical protein
MRALALGLLIGTALSARAQTAQAPDADNGPLLVRPEAVSRQAEDLRDAVASPSVSDYAVHQQAEHFFGNIQSETPVVRARFRRMDREHVDGRVGTVDGMIETAQQRWDHYRMRTAEVPAAELDGAIVFAKDLRRQKRADFDPSGRMPENQMGVFRYAKDQLQGGMVQLNARLAMITTRLGEAFAYATLVHEAAHAKAREEGRLSPERVIDGEVEAYRVQCRWLKVVDPSEERLFVLHSALTMRLQSRPEDRISAQALSYVVHLIELYDTDGDEAKLREYIKKLGYEEGDHDHDGGADPAAAPIRA